MPGFESSLLMTFKVGTYWFEVVATFGSIASPYLKSILGNYILYIYIELSYGNHKSFCLNPNGLFEVLSKHSRATVIL